MLYYAEHVTLFVGYYYAKHVTFLSVVMQNMWHLLSLLYHFYKNVNITHMEQHVVNRVTSIEPQWKKSMFFTARLITRVSHLGVKNMKKLKKGIKITISYFTVNKESQGNAWCLDFYCILAICNNCPWCINMTVAYCIVFTCMWTQNQYISTSDAHRGITRVCSTWGKKQNGPLILLFTYFAKRLTPWKLAWGKVTSTFYTCLMHKDISNCWTIWTCHLACVFGLCQIYLFWVCQIYAWSYIFLKLGTILCPLEVAPRASAPLAPY